jgi:hypothetical protein
MLFIFNYIDTWMDRIHDFANSIVDRLVFDSISFFDEYNKIYLSLEEKESTEKYESKVKYESRCECDLTPEYYYEYNLK